MSRPVHALTVLILLSGLTAGVLPVLAVDSTAIRDIRGPLPPDGLFPFGGSVLVLLVAGIVLALTAKARIRKSSSMVIPSPVQSFGIVDLEALRDAYARAELPAALLFQHLAGIARSRLVQSDSEAMTSAEVLKAAGESVPAEIITVAADLFAVCDRVRFGGCCPDTAAVVEAFAAVQLLLQRQPVTVP